MNEFRKGKGQKGFDSGKGFGKNGGFKGGYGEKGGGKGFGQKGKGTYMFENWNNNNNIPQTNGNNGAWTLSLTKRCIPPGLPSKVEATNSFKVLMEEDTEELAEKNMLDIERMVKVSEVYSTKFPAKAMGNYSKKSVKFQCPRTDMRKVKKEQRSSGCTRAPGSDEPGVAKPRHSAQWPVENVSRPATAWEVPKTKPMNLFVREPMATSQVTKELNSVEYKKETDGWVKVKGAMDSGATESVAPPDMCPHYKVNPSPGSLAGVNYVSASDDLIPNLGEQVLDVQTLDGREGQVKYQIADVARPLNSVSEICDAGGVHGQHVIFGRYGGAIINLDTGRQVPFPREDGIYNLEFWVKPRGEQGTSVFPRPGE